MDDERLKTSIYCLLGAVALFLVSRWFPSLALLGAVAFVLWITGSVYLAIAKNYNAAWGLIGISCLGTFILMLLPTKVPRDIPPEAFARLRDTDDPEQITDTSQGNSDDDSALRNDISQANDGTHSQNGSVIKNSLRELADLKSEGLITEDEYSAKKRDLLSKL